MFYQIPELKRLQAYYDSVTYLEKMIHEDVEDVLYQIYEPTLMLVGYSSRPFKNFTKENYDTLNRFKWRQQNNALNDK